MLRPLGIHWTFIPRRIQRVTGGKSDNTVDMCMWWSTLLPLTHPPPTNLSGYDDEIDKIETHEEIPNDKAPSSRGVWDLRSISNPVVKFPGAIENAYLTKLMPNTNRFVQWQAYHSSHSAYQPTSLPVYRPTGLPRYVVYWGSHQLGSISFGYLIPHRPRPSSST